MAGGQRGYERGQEEFQRVLTFSDGLFAIAMTLLVVGIGVPKVAEAKLHDALADLWPQIITFFISFIVIGYYWLAHHRFFAQLRLIDSRLMTFNLVYLAAIAFVPFPTALVGRYENSPIAVIIYAITLGVASLIEVVMFGHARRTGALRSVLPEAVFRYGIIASLIPVFVFALSIPIALVSGTWALVSWLAIAPAERILDRWKPAGTEELLA